MTPLSSLVDPTLVERLGWTLVHSTWQGAIIAAVAAVLFYALRAARPQLRYLLACLSLASMVATAIVTFTVIRPSSRDRAIGTGASAAIERASTQWTLLDTQAGVNTSAGSATTATGTPGTSLAADTTDRAPAASRVEANVPTGGIFEPGAWRRAALIIERLLPQFVALWIVGLMICSIRLLGALALVEHLKRHQTHPMPREWQQRVVALARRMRVRGAQAITVRASIEARTAAVIGWLRPVILVPASALAGLTTQQLEAVLAHELAHIRRHDYLVNLVQSLAETLFFYHPAVWYLSRAIRTEREHCCDDEAVAVVGDAVAYAGALTDLELLRQRTPVLAMAANGGSLLRRIQRLLAPSTDTAPSWSTATSLLGLAVVIFGIASARGSIAASLQTASTPASASAASTVQPGDSRDTPRAATTASSRDQRAPRAARAEGDWDAQPPAPPAPPEPAPATAPVALPRPPEPPRAALPPDPLETDDTPAPPAAPAPPAPFVGPAPTAAPVPPAPFMRPALAAVPAPPAPGAPPATAPVPAVLPTPFASPVLAVPPAPHPAPAPPAPAPAVPMGRVYASTAPMPPAAPAPAPRASAMTAMLTPPAAPPQAAAPQPPPPPPPGGLERAKRWLESWFEDDGNNWTWQENGHRFQIRSRGTFDITDDDLDIKTVTAGGYVTLEERVNGLTSRVEIRNTDGNLQRAFFRNGQGVAWEPEGRAWLAKKIPDLVRRTGFGAQGRVRRILARGGPTAVLDEVTIIQSSYVKRIYLERLLAETTLQGPMLARLLTQAGKEITSDYERATLLIKVTKSGQITTDEQRLAYAVATHTIKSGYEHRRALEPFVMSATLSEPVLKTVLDSASRIESDYELASLLIPIGKTQALTPGSMDAYVLAAQTIDSDYELRRALTPLLMQPAPVPPAVLQAVFRSSAGIDSDYELATLLVDLVNRQKVDESNKVAFFQAVDTIQSDYERGRALKAMVARGAIGDALALGVIESTHRMNSAYEAANVLKGVAASQPLDGPLRKAYITAAERLSSDHERDGALVMLVRNEARAR